MVWLILGSPLLPPDPDKYEFAASLEAWALTGKIFSRATNHCCRVFHACLCKKLWGISLREISVEILGMMVWCLRLLSKIGLSPVSSCGYGLFACDVFIQRILTQIIHCWKLYMYLVGFPSNCSLELALARLRRHLHLTIFAKNSTRYFWLFNSILWLSRGPCTRGSCSWMVRIETCLPRNSSKKNGKRLGKNPSRTICTCCMLGSVFKPCTITWVWHDNAHGICSSLCFHCLHQCFPWLRFRSLHLGLCIQKSSFYLCIFIVLV